VIIAQLVSAPFLLAAFSTSTPLMFLSLVLPAWLLGAVYVGLGASVIRSIAPETLRGRIAAVYLTTANLFGMSVGPPHGGRTDRQGIRNQAMIGISLAITLWLLNLSTPSLQKTSEDYSLLLISCGKQNERSAAILFDQ
jgi:MFS family permease